MQPKPINQNENFFYYIYWVNPINTKHNITIQNPHSHFTQNHSGTFTPTQNKKKIKSYLALGALLGTSGSNSTGKPKNPLNLSKVTCATWRTLVGQPISIAQSSLLSLLQGIKDFLKKVTSNAKRESCSLLRLSRSFTSQSVTADSQSSSSLRWGA